MEHKVWIVWGESTTVRECGENVMFEYAFNTPEELNAFLMGVQESNGWNEYEQCDTEQEALDYIDACKLDR